MEATITNISTYLVLILKSGKNSFSTVCLVGKISRKS
ncbi:hypothetical protein LINPERHAP2_LOCUS32921 [Linum perenne]